MPPIHPYLKISAVFFVCCSMCYMQYLLFNALDFIVAVKESSFLLGSGVVYIAVIFFFAQYYFRKKRWVVLAVWLLFNASLCVNFGIYFGGGYPSLSVQYTQSSSLLVYACLLLLTKDSFPNWLRIFSLACLLILIPCLIFYFSEQWQIYMLTVYILCFTPVIKGLAFLKDVKRENRDLLDAD